MERLERAEELMRLQAYGAERLSERGLKIEDIPAIVDSVLAARNPVASAQARSIVAEIMSNHGRITAPYEVTEEDAMLRAAVLEAPAGHRTQAGGT